MRKDMQEDKEPAFDALDASSLALAAMTGMVEDMEPNAEAMRRGRGAGFSTATDLADWLVREAGPAVPRGPSRDRRARRAGRREQAIRACTSCDLADMQKVDTRITDDVFGVLTRRSLGRLAPSFGGTAPTTSARGRALAEALTA